MCLTPSGPLAAFAAMRVPALDAVASERVVDGAGVVAELVCHLAKRPTLCVEHDGPVDFVGRGGAEPESDAGSVQTLGDRMAADAELGSELPRGRSGSIPGNNPLDLSVGEAQARKRLSWLRCLIRPRYGGQIEAVVGPHR